MKVSEDLIRKRSHPDRNLQACNRHCYKNTLPRCLNELTLYRIFENQNSYHGVIHLEVLFKKNICAMRCTISTLVKLKNPFRNTP